MPQIDYAALNKLIHDVKLAEKLIVELTSIIWRSTIPIIVNQDGVFRQHGTGTFLAIAERRFLLTAGHVFREAQKLGFNLFIGPSGGESGLHHLNYSRYLTPDEPYDVGISELPPNIEQVLGNHYRFIRIADIGTVDGLDTDLYMLCGCPTSEAKEGTAENKTVQLRKMAFLTYPHIGEALPAYDETVHFAFEGRRKHAVGVFDDGSVIPEELGGISGCGIWKMNLGADPENWMADRIRMIGIQTSVYTKSEVIKGTSLKVILKIIYQKYEELRPSIEFALTTFGR